MAPVRWVCPVLMIPSLAGLLSADTVSKSVCYGNSIQLFDNIQINDNHTSASLYKNDETMEMLARWTIKGHNFFINNSNFFMDGKNNLWISNVHPTDDALYRIRYEMYNGTILITGVQLSVLVAPKKCYITTDQKGQVVTVAVTGKEKDDCGKPRVSVYWKNSTSVTLHDENALRLQFGNDAETFYACMKGIALSCANSSDPSADFCQPKNVNKGQFQPSTVGSTTQLSSEDGKDPLLIAIVVLQSVGLVVVPFISFGIYILYKHNRCCCKRHVVHTPRKPEEFPLQDI